jgi:predicted nucleotidyltransferase
MMASSDKHAALEFKRRAAALVPILQCCVFGSRARGDATDGSDLDIFLVVDHLDAGLREKISEVAWEVGFENDVVLSTFLSLRPSSWSMVPWESIRSSARSRKRVSACDRRAAIRKVSIRTIWRYNYTIV